MHTHDPDQLNRRTFIGTAGAVAAGAALGAAAAGAQEGAAETTVLRVAMLSAWHAHAQGYARGLQTMPNAQITAVWDEDPERGKEWAASLQVPFEPDLQAVLTRDDVDAVACNAPTTMHAEVLTASAEAGKHIFTEKVMAPTIAEAEQIARAVNKAGVKFCISYPHRTRPETLYAHKAVQDGLLGRLTALRVRVAHNGVSGGWLPPHFEDPVGTAGGAMMDLGAHPMYLARWIGGRPTRVSSLFTYVFDRPVEDNAVSLIEFENRAIAVSETSFVATASPFSLELAGTEGSLVVGGPDRARVQIRSTKLNGGDWVTPEVLPEALPQPLEIWVNGVLEGTPIPFGVEEGIQLTELMEYAYKSYREGALVEIPERAPLV
jgi:1,5-anhydro-D-fructose reductase (1,5-anhydro-D-mannitol-forming)